MGSEVWQFLAVIRGFFVVAALWLVVYLPGRTLERWEGQRRGKAGPADGGPDGPLKPES